MDGSATCSIKLLSKSYCQNMSVLNTWNTLPRNNRRVLHGIVCSRFCMGSFARDSPCRTPRNTS